MGQKMYSDSRGAIISIIGIRYVQKHEGSSYSQRGVGAYHITVKYKGDHIVLSYQTPEERDMTFDNLIKLLTKD